MTRPTKGTPEYELWLAAIDIAHAVPLDANRATTFAAKVPWSRIDALRDALEACGVDWRGHHPATKAGDA